MISPWTVVDDDKLKNLYADKAMSCATIAGYFPGRSRNSIIGRVHRLKLPLRGTVQPRTVRPRALQPWDEAGVSRRTYFRDRAGPRIKAIPREEAVLRCAEIDPHHVAISDVDGCRWPYGDGPFTFCNHPQFGPSSYCGAHFFLSVGAGTGSERAAHKFAKQKLQGAWG